ncbi:ABC transporter substrate-binding protein [Paenarthrobacter nitroguajacolicus]|uniref:ABC transporter substrate-binding protein n=1 Tax=Paenarthrobacter nitroguajacolicus TaxID=211146 RepID=UPI0040547793
MPRMRLRGGRAVAVAGALAFIGTSLAACGNQAPAPAAGQEFKVAIFGGSIISIYPYIGVSEGFYKAEGLDVSLVEIASGPQATAALSSGSIDLMLNTPDSALSAKQQGFDTIAVTGNLKKPLFQLIVKDKSKFPHAGDGYPAVMQDVVDKKVSTYVLGSAMDRFVKLLLTGADLPADSATFVPVGGTGQGTSALEAGQIDVQTDVINPGIVSELSGRGSVLVDCSLVSCGEAVDAAGAMSQATWTTQKAMDKNPSAYKAFATAQGKISAWASDPQNSKALLAIMEKYLPVPAGVEPAKFYSTLQEIMPRYLSVEVSKDAIDASMEAMLETGELKKPLDTSTMVWSEARLVKAP